MSGPCESPSPHGWTLDTLEEHLTTKITSVKDFFVAESRASKEAVSAALAAVKEQSAGAMIAAEKAIIKAETATEKRFDSVNEFRQTLSDQAASFLSRNEYSANHKATEEKLIALADRISRIETAKTTKSEGVSTIGMALAVAFSGVSMLTTIIWVAFVILKGH